MAARFRFSFLPAFFTVLIGVFAIAVVLRIRSYTDGPSVHVADSPQQAPVDATAGSRRVAGQPSIVTESDGTVVTPGGESPGDGTPEMRRVREQRYRELLNTPIASSTSVAPNGGTTAPPPLAPQKTTPPKPAPQNPSLLSRIVAPIARAFGGAGSAPQAAHTASTSTAPTTAREPKDPDSDTMAPRLVSAVFDPPTVHDGEETTLIIVATDDLSGVRSIAGNVVSPSGALQGFAVNRDGTDPTRFLARIAVPKSAAEGLWRVNYLNLSDNANNSTTLTASQGSLSASAGFRVVSSNADSTPPTLRAVWLDRPSMRGGEKNVIFVQADDDKSGVNLVSGVFLSPSKLARIGFGCRPPEAGNTFTCEFIPPRTADCGDWQLEQVQLQDKANNMTAVRRDNPMVDAVRASVLSEQCDSHPPAVQGIALDRYATPAPGTIVIRINVSDDISGVGSVSGHFVFTGTVEPGTQPPKAWFACSMTDPQTWSGNVVIPANSPTGVWRLEQLQTLDKSNNLKIYAPNDPVISSVTFRVQ